MFFCSIIHAQELVQPHFKTDSAGNRIDLRFEGYYNSLDFPNSFTSLFYNGGFLDSTLKSEISERLGAENRMGAELGYGISYYNYHAHLFGKPEWGWMASVENMGSYYLQISKNAFDLLFYGNSRFAGDTVQLADIKGEAMSWQKFTFGGFHKNNHSSVAVSFLKGQNYAGMNIKNANLYTAPMGQELALELDAQITRSDSLQKGLDAFNGWGLSTDLVFYLNTGKNRNVKFKNAFRISIQNLGFISWNEKSLQTSLDTSYQFEGFQVDDLFDSTSFNFSERAKDTFQIETYNRSFTSILPFTFSFAKIADPNSEDKLQGLYGVRLRAYSVYRPLFFAGLHYRASSKLNMNMFASVGGYGGFKLGYSLHLAPIKNMNIYLSCSNLLGFSKNGYGKDATLNLSYAF